MKESVCQECNTTFSRRRQGAGDTFKFCSRSCSAKTNNRLRTRKQWSKVRCSKCLRTLDRRNKSGTCRSCKEPLDYSDVTLRDWKDQLSTLSYHAKIRGAARVVYMRSQRPKKCFACGYDLHVDICHIKDIKEFDLDTPVSVVNALANLVALDKRCHWEFDNGYLKLEGSA